jgi:hypothetical protein
MVWSCASGTSGGDSSSGSGAGNNCSAIEWYRDADGDGYGSDELTTFACEQPEGYVAEGGDCDDATSVTHPGADEDCGVDEDFNCDGSTGFDDADDDGIAACDDCDDTNPNVYPGADEICDGVDNDCDMLIDLDDEPDDELCAPVVNASVLCMDPGVCTFSCADDWFNTNVDAADGCECEVVPAPATIGDSCANPIDLGNLTDAMADLITADGNSPTMDRETWYVFTAIDDIDTAGDEFHVDVRFLVNPSTAYEMTIYRGDCPGTGVEVATDETDTFDWYTDFPYTAVGCSVFAPCGEGDCSDVPSTTVNMCEDDTAPFYVKITRTDQQASCELYTLELSNGVY